jgi:hypothetical protein
VAPVVKIPLEPIASSSLKAIGYDLSTQTLAIQFQNGRVFYYEGVVVDVALELGASGSKGTFYSTRIKHQFKGRPVTGPCKMCGLEGYVEEPCACGKGKHAAATKATSVICPDCHGAGAPGCRTCDGRGTVRAK